MLQFLPLITSLLEGKKKDAEAQKQNNMSIYMGQAPTAQGGNTEQAASGALTGLLQKGFGGGGDKGYAGGAGKFDTGNPRYDDRTPQMGSNLTQGTNSLLDDAIGPLGNLDDNELL